jgi:hypothetical protein
MTMYRAAMQRDCIEFVFALARIIITMGRGRVPECNQVIASLTRIVERLRG